MKYLHQGDIIGRKRQSALLEVVMKYAGIDVGQSFHLVNLPSDRESGISKKIYCDQFEIMVSVLREAEIDAVILEPTGPYSPPLIRKLKGENFLVYYVHPKRFAEFRSQRDSKNDKKDAKLLRQYAEYGNDRQHTYYEFTDRLLYAKELQNIQSLKIHYEKVLNSETNRLRQELYQLGFEKESSAPLGQLLKLAEKDFPETCVIIRNTFEIIERKKKEIREYVENNEEIRNMVDLLETIPGFGFDLAVFFVTKIGDINRFSSYKEFKSFTGFGSKTIQSGTSINGKKKVQSHSLFKKYLFLFVMRALRLAAMKGRKNRKKADSAKNIQTAFNFYKRKTGGKGIKAMMMIAAKTVKRIFFMLKNNVAWNPEIPYVAGGEEMLRIMSETENIKKNINKGKNIQKTIEKGVEKIQKGIIFVESS